MRETPRPLETQGAAESVESAQHVEPLKGHIASLDGVRGLAILLVLMIHFCCLTGGQPRRIADRLFYKCAFTGWCGVDLFFLLSGFLITGILFDTKFSRHRMKNFYARRSLRIFPLYYGVVILWFLVLPMINPAWNYASGWPLAKKVCVWLYAVNWGWVCFNYDFGVMDHFWSLAIEEHFYLVWPLVIWFFSRKTAMRICIACCGASALSRALLLTLGVIPSKIWKLDTSHIDSLCLGGWLALTARGPSGSAPLVGPAKKVAVLAFFALVCVILWRTGMNHMDGMFQILGIPPLVVFFGASLVLVVHAPLSSPLGMIFNSGLMRFFGKYSYGLYVWHWLLSDHFEVWFPTKQYQVSFGEYIPAVAAHAILCSMVTILVAVISYKIYEKMFINMKRFFEPRRP